MVSILFFEVHFHCMLLIFVAVPKCLDPVVLHAQGGAGVLAVSVEVGQTRAGHQVAQVAIVCCEVIISWTCGMRMAKDITRAVFPFGEPEEEIVFIPDYWGDVGSLDEIVLNTTSHIQALLPHTDISCTPPHCLAGELARGEDLSEGSMSF